MTAQEGLAHARLRARPPRSPRRGCAVRLPWPEDVKIDSDTFGGLEARSIGPAAMSGRIAALDAVEGDRLTIWVGAAGGGVWKSTDGGLQFKPVFDKHTQSIGAIRIDPKDPKTVWVGTGESWVRNSVVRRATGSTRPTDGGDNWETPGPREDRAHRPHRDRPQGHRHGLRVRHRPRLRLRTPTAASSARRTAARPGRRCCSSTTTPAAPTSPSTPRTPAILYAGMWQFRRKAYFFTSGGPGSGLFKSTDGGTTWRKIQNGLPKADLGRIAVAVAPSRPERRLRDRRGEGRDRALPLRRPGRDLGQDEHLERGHGPAVLLLLPRGGPEGLQPGLQAPDHHASVSDDGGKTFSGVGGGSSAPATTPTATPSGSTRAEHGQADPGHRRRRLHLRGPRRELALRGLPARLAVLPRELRHGVAVQRLRRPAGQLHLVRPLAPARPHRATSTGTRSAAATASGPSWTPNDPDVVYNEIQGGNLFRMRKSTLETKDIKPSPKAGEPKYRFNWNTPIHMSPSEKGTLYYGAQFLFRSRDQGDTWERISPDLTTNDPAQAEAGQSGGLTLDNSTAENHCTIFAIAESPKNKDVIWVGTDDGNVQVTRDGGKTWTNVVAEHPRPAQGHLGHDGRGQPLRRRARPTPPSTATCAGRHEDLRLPDHRLRQDLDRRWPPATCAATPTWSARTCVNPDLLFLGTELGLFVSVDGGQAVGPVHGQPAERGRARRGDPPARPRPA